MPGRCFTVATSSVLCLVAAHLCALPARAECKIRIPERAFNFQSVGLDDPLEHTFQIENVGDEVVELKNILVSPPLWFKNVPRKIQPGARVDLTVRLLTPRVQGEYEGWVEVLFQNESLTNEVLEVTGKIVPPIEVLPYSAFFLSVQRHRTNQATLTIVNREKEPLQITDVIQKSSRFETRLKTAEPGQKYTVTLTVKGEGKAGRSMDEIYLFTSSKKKPVLTIQVNIVIKERVYTFPDLVDFGTIQISELTRNPELIDFLTQTLMLYQSGGKDFQVKTFTDLTFINLLSERSKFGDRYQMTIGVIPENLEPGPVDGRIMMETNDPEFPYVEVPVKGTIVR